MTAFAPELGQMAFSNTPWQKIELSQTGGDAIGLLAHIVHDSRAGKYDKWGPTHLLTGNVGGEFVNDTFALRAYCWCDGEVTAPEGGETYGHDGECPPNFHHHASDVRVSWYKYLGRGDSINREVSASEWLGIVVDCARSVGWTG